MTTARPDFDPSGPLPGGTALLEASAGTGKTHTIAGLACRYLAEGVASSVDRLMIVTFSRDAARELRSRVRDRIVAELADTSPGGLARQRLAAALDGFDRATIMTIHEFCQAMVTGLGVLACADPSGSLVEDLGPLVSEIAQDLYLSSYAGSQQRPAMPFRSRERDWVTVAGGALDLTADALRTPDAPLVPAGNGDIAERVGFARRARTEAAARKHRLGVYTFDDQLLRLRDSLTEAGSGAEACRRLRDRFDVVLVDEFQDTDPVQWEILQRTFHGHRPLVLIGDPKQAIYAFRGADVRSYLTAAGEAKVHAGLSVNHRADAAVVEALDRLLAGLNLGEGIDVHPTSAKHRESRLHAGAVAPSPFRLRVLPRERKVAPARQAIAHDLVGVVRELLAGGFRLTTAEGQRPLRAGDLAILVRRNRTGRDLVEALRRAGVPVAFSGAENLFASEAARAWEDLLAAMANPRPAAVRAAACTVFLGKELADLADADGDTLGEWTAAIRRWERVLHRDGVAAAFATIAGETELTRRVLSRPDGERLMTDIRHLTQLLHEAAGRHTSATWLAGWLADQLALAGGSDERTRRLETDAQAVQVRTIHKAKGLQFPVVLLPDLWDGRVRDVGDEQLVVHAPDGTRVLDVGGAAAPGRQVRVAAHQAEEAEDSLRTLYVALTRAQSQVVCWWARTRNTPSSALQRVLYRSGDRRPAARYELDVPPADADPGDLPWLSGAGIAVEEIVQAATEPAPAAGPAMPPPLRHRQFTRSIDLGWRRTSYSGLTSGVHAEGPLLADEPVDADEEATAVPLSPMAALPGGVQFGSLVHAVFEVVDPHCEPDELRRRLEAAAADLLARFPLPEVTVAALAEAMLPGFLTPLPLAGGRRLADVAAGDRLPELDFDLQLSDHGSTTLADVADLLEAHLDPGDILAGYPQRLRDPALAEQPLRGFLTGSIDAVLRIDDGDGPRHLVVDYKTNRLGGAEPGPGAYGRASMGRAMQDSHYPLQALLYCVALHRFLAARLAGYRPEQHLGGVLYLFVRGMTGGLVEPVESRAEASPGVFEWAPPPALVVALSRLLAGQEVTP